MSLFIKKYFWVFTLLTIACCMYFLAKTVNTVVADGMIVDRQYKLDVINTPPESSDPNKTLASRDGYQAIVDRNIFDSKSESKPAESLPAETQATKVPDKNAPPVKTSLKIKLVSTFSVGKGEDDRSTATIQGEGAQSAAEVYKVNDSKEFAPSAKVVRILPDRVEFKNNGRMEYVEIEKIGNKPADAKSPVAPKPEEKTAKTPSTVAKQGENKFVVDKAELDDALDPANLPKLLMQANAVGNFVGGKSSGLKLLSVNPGSLFAKLGLQRGDVIEAINGQEIDIVKGPERLMQLRNQSRITIDLVRNGQKVTQEYDIR